MEPPSPWLLEFDYLDYIKDTLYAYEKSMSQKSHVNYILEVRL